MRENQTEPSPEVRVRFDRSLGDEVVDLEIEAHRAGSVIAAVAAAARGVRAVIQRLELRPRRDTVGARIHLSSDRAARLSRRERGALIAAVLGAIDATTIPAPAAG